jgi:putative transposase
MSETRLYRAVRYVERNPVAADLWRRPEQWMWSSARARLQARDDILVRVAPMLGRVDNWRAFLAQVDRADVVAELEKLLRSGRPLGDAAFLDLVERVTGRYVRCRRSSRSKAR